jgi:hypothetical protein
MKKSIVELIRTGNFEQLQQDYFPELDLQKVKKIFGQVKEHTNGISYDQIVGLFKSAKVDTGSILKYGATILGVVNGFSGSLKDAMSNLADGFVGTMKEDVVDLKSMTETVVNDIKGLKLGQLLGDFLRSGVDTVSKSVANAIAAEGDARETVNKEMGIAGELADRYRAALVDAYNQTILLGAQFKDIQEIVAGTSNSLLTAKILTADTIEKIYETGKALGVSNTLIAESAGAFEDISVGISSVPGLLDKAGAHARSVGLNVKQYTETLTKHITLLNQFGFKNGIEGLSKMVEKAQSLRLEMSTITNLAEKVFNPEGAIELSATLNAIGAGFGSFADPLKLVYQSTNDLGGLQDTLTNAAASLATFNQQSGRFEITAVNMRKAKDMADALGMSYQDLTNLAVRAAQKQEMALKVDRIGGFNEESRDFMKNMAEMKDGKIVVSVGNTLGDEAKKFGQAFQDGYIDISKLTDEGIGKLREDLDKYQQEANKKPTEIATDQLRELERIQLTVKDIAFKMGVGIARSSTVQTPLKEVRDYLNDQNRQNISKQTKVIVENTQPDFSSVENSLSAIFDVATKQPKTSTNTERVVEKTNNNTTKTEKVVDRKSILEKTRTYTVTPTVVKPDVTINQKEPKQVVQKTLNYNVTPTKVEKPQTKTIPSDKKTTVIIPKDVVPLPKQNTIPKIEPKTPSKKEAVLAKTLNTPPKPLNVENNKTVINNTEKKVTVLTPTPKTEVPKTPSTKKEVTPKTGETKKPIIVNKITTINNAPSTKEPVQTKEEKKPVIVNKTTTINNTPSTKPPIPTKEEKKPVIVNTTPPPVKTSQSTTVNNTYNKNVVTATPKVEVPNTNVPIEKKIPQEKPEKTVVIKEGEPTQQTLPHVTEKKTEVYNEKKITIVNPPSPAVKIPSEIKKQPVLPEQKQITTQAVPVDFVKPIVVVPPTDKKQPEQPKAVETKTVETVKPVIIAPVGKKATEEPRPVEKKTVVINPKEKEITIIKDRPNPQERKPLDLKPVVIKPVTENKQPIKATTTKIPEPKSQKATAVLEKSTKKKETKVIDRTVEKHTEKTITVAPQKPDSTVYKKPVSVAPKAESKTLHKERKPQQVTPSTIEPKKKPLSTGFLLPKTKEKTPDTENKTSQTDVTPKKDIKIDVDIHSSQTLYDDLVRNLLRDGEFIAQFKKKFKESDM